jgi:hypothetical protein
VVECEALSSNPSPTKNLTTKLEIQRSKNLIILKKSIKVKRSYETYSRIIHLATKVNWRNKWVLISQHSFSTKCSLLCYFALFLRLIRSLFVSLGSLCIRDFYSIPVFLFKEIPNKYSRRSNQGSQHL